MADNSRRRFRYARRPLAERMKEFNQRKPRGPLLPGRTLNPRQQKELRRANHRLAVGDHANAGFLFENMANRAYDRGIPYPAPMLFLQAAHAYLLAEDLQASLAAARRGLELLVSQERWAQLHHEGQRYLAEAAATEGAAQLAAWLAEVTPQPVPQLPATQETCPYCGAHGSLLPMAAGRASSCRYCESVVLAR